MLFGEGTSSDGNRVLPFRTALIGAARVRWQRLNTLSAYGSTIVDRLYPAAGVTAGRQHRPHVPGMADPRYGRIFSGSRGG